jgi:hypothetical protein
VRNVINISIKYLCYENYDWIKAPNNIITKILLKGTEHKGYDNFKNKYYTKYQFDENGHKNIVIWRLKAGMVEQEQMSIARQRLGKHLFLWQLMLTKEFPWQHNGREEL